ncbi:MAG: hypothetical protein RLP44_19880 [Aggregatilineales bacterium]
MPISVKRLENQPILIATFTGNITADDMAGMFEESNTLIGENEDHIYRISDVSNATSNFVEMFGVIKIASKGQPGSTSDPRIQAFFVGTSTWITFARNTLRAPAFGGLQIAAFETMDAALDAINTQLVITDEQLKTY